jgi:TonB-linked SusC/RagA family outer membrane protein
MKTPWLGRVFRVVTALTAGLVATSALSAQSVTFTGRVLRADGQALAGANVGITELGVGTVAATDGRYTFTVDQSRIAGRSLNVVARFIGYKPKRLPVLMAPGTGRIDHDFVLERDVLNLEEVVVTGTSAATEQKKTPFQVSVIDNTQLKEAPAVSPVGSLEGKVPGASVITTSGQPGSEPAIRLRSATSLTGRQDPLIIVDGTITRLGLADINSEDIERVEIIKGAAASSLYGSDAANGVIQIFTKRGTSLGDGQTLFTFRNELGQSDIPKFLPTNQHNPYEVTTDASGHTTFVRDANGNRITKPDAIADSPYPVTYDQMDEVFKPGTFLTNYLSVGQRRGSTNLNASFQNTRDQGVLTMLHGYRRQNMRVNVDQALTDKIDLGVGAFYGRSTADQGEATGIFFGMRFLEPNVRLDSVIGSGPYKGQFNPNIKQPPLSGNVQNPLYELQQQQVSNDRDRFTGTFKTNYRPTNWLTFDGNVGYDESGQNYKQFVPLGYSNSSGNRGAGSLFEQDDTDRSYNISVTGTTSGTWGSIHNVTKGAFLYEDQTNQFVSVNAPALTVTGVPEFSSAKLGDVGNQIGPGSRTETIRARDEFLVSTFEIKDRYILDGLVRKDASSLFGSAERSQTYQRLSGAWRVTQDMHLPFVDELKLRGSHGTAGLRPPFTAQYEVFSVASGVPEKISLGNKELKPAYSTENELGFDLNKGNYSLEYSYSKKRTTDEIIKVPLSSASGYQTQWQNAGTLSGHSHEAALGAVLLSRADYFFRLNITADRTRNRIESLNVAPFLVGPSDATTNTQIFRIGPGEPLGVIYGSKWVKTAAQLSETIKSGQLSGTASDYVLNEEGYYVAKSAYHTVGEVPLKAFTCLDAGCTKSTSNVQIGDVNPDFNMGFNGNLQWKAVTANATLTWVRGGNIYNYTRQWPFNELRDAVMDQSGKPSAGNCPDLSVDPQCPYKTGKKATTYYSAFYNNFDPNSYFVEDGGYWRLRELAVNFALPTRLAERIPGGNFHTARIGIVGRNLWTKTNYSGYDPDVTGPGGGNPFAYRVDYFTYPAYRTFTAMFELGF